MHDPLNIFDQCHTFSMAREYLCCLAVDLLTLGGGGSSHLCSSLSLEKVEALIKDLSTLPYELLEKRKNPVLAISEACRLLIRSGRPDFMHVAKKLAHTLYQFQDFSEESRRLCYLYKGMAEIGLGEHGIGFKNVRMGLSGTNACGLYSEDQALGYWALASAAVRDRNLKIALRFTDEWLKLTQNCRLIFESFRALSVRQILLLLNGNKLLCSEGISELQKQIPSGMEDTAAFLNEWTEALLCGSLPSLAPPPDSLPLLLGLPFSDKTENKFSMLCHQLRKACDLSYLENLDSERLKDYVQLAAEWELSGPLQRFERLLKSKDQGMHYQIILDRMLGSQISKCIQERKPEDPEVKLHEDAIILAMDVRDYSTFSRKMAGSERTDFEVLNPLFKLMNEDLEELEGNVIEFKGDSIILAFNTFAPSSTDFSKVLFQAVRTARRVLLLSLHAMEAGLPEIRIGIGLHRGSLATGFLGGLDRCFLTPLGETINLAARLESLSKDVPGSIVVSRRCFSPEGMNMWRASSDVNFTVRDMGSQSIKNMDSVEVLALRPLVPYWVDFVPMGFMAESEPGVVYIDTGNAADYGVIDHHHKNGDAEEGADSACQLLLDHPEWLYGHLLKLTPSSPDEDPKRCLKDGSEATRLEFRMHTEPDLDCAATFYAACEMLERNPRMECLKQLAEYVSKVDQGRMAGDPLNLEKSLYGIFIAHQHLTRKTKGRNDFCQLEAGLRVIDAAMFLMEKVRNPDLSDIFSHKIQWFGEERQRIRDDLNMYEKDRSSGHTYTARINRKGRPEKVEGIWLDHPRSSFFKFWVRNDPKAPGGRGYAFMAVDWSKEEGNRFVFSVDPEADCELEGLGEVLEARETELREEKGRRRPKEPCRPGAENSDPWYFGWGHHFTIVDSPREGTVMSAEEAEEIHKNW
jgi:class 3 adenylate cyclase